MTASDLMLPPRLERGARVALIAPAGLVPGEREGDPGGLHPRLAAGLARLQAEGFRPVLGRHARARHGYLAGRDEERLADLAWALTADDVDAVLCIRGGYGSPRLLEQPGFADVVRALRERPRAILGFSDLTALLTALTRHTGVPTFHGPTLGSLDEDYNLAALLAVVGPEAAAPLAVPLPGASDAPQPRALVGGTAEGPLVGGNLSLLCSLAGTPHAPDPRGAVLLLEDVGEPPYRLDRMLTHLRLAGWLDQVAGIVVGELVRCEPPAGRPSFSAAEVLADRLGGLGVPCLVDFPCAHGRYQATLPLGARVRLDAGAGTLTILEPVVS